MGAAGAQSFGLQPRRVGQDCWIPVGLGTLALALRLLHLRFSAKMLLADDAEFFEQHAREYLDAWRAVGTSAWWPALRHAIDESSLQGPVFPFFESVVYLAAGSVNHLALAVVQVILGAATVVLTYLAGRRAFGNAAGTVAGLLALVYPPLIASNTQLLAEASMTFIQALAAYCLIRGLAPGHRRARIAGGVCIGLLMLRPALQYSGAILLLALLVVGFRGWAVRAGALALPYLLGVLLVAAPWMLTNGLVFGQFAWSRTGDAWHQIYWGIYPPNHGWWPPDSPVPPKYGVESLPGARSAGVVIDERDIDYLYAAIDQVRATPVKAAATEVNKLYQSYLHPSDTYGEHPPLVGSAAVPLHRSLLLLTLAGLCFGWIDCRRRAAWLVLAAALFASALPFLASHIDLRYTIPPSQLECLFAGLALVQAYSAIKCLWLAQMRPQSDRLGSTGHVSGGAPFEPVPSRRPERSEGPAAPSTDRGQKEVVAGVVLALPFVVWATGVPWWLALLPRLPPWPVHLVHTAAMCLALLAAAFGAAWLLARSRGSAWTGLLPRPYAAGALVLGTLVATIYGSEALYEGDWHQWSTALRPGDAVQQTFVLPTYWRPPAGGRAEVRLYLTGSPAQSYEPVLSADGQPVARLGPGLSETGPLRFWEKIMVAARNQGKTRPEVAQWVAFPLDLTTLSKPELTVELSVVPVPDAAPGAPEGALRIWGDYAPRRGVRLYEGPPAYSRIQGQDEAFLKYIATGEYGIWRWQPLQSVATRSARRLASSPSDTVAPWRADDLSDAPGRQLGEYRMRIVVYAANGDLAALF